MGTTRTKLTTDGQFFGTPLYMSPEQAQGLELGPRSDLFSLGAVAYNLLTGHAAFAADTIPEIMQRVVVREPRAPSSFVSDLPPAVDSMMARVLAKDPKDRYPDGESLAEDIKEILGGRAPHEYQIVAPASEPVRGLPPEPPRGGDESERPRLDVVGVATRPGGDIEAELETLMSGLVPCPIRGANRCRLRPPRAPCVPAKARQRLLVAALSLVAALVAWAIAAYVLRSAVTPPSASPTLARTDRPSPAPATPVPPSSEAVKPSVPASASGLAIDFEYPLKDGRLAVWIDGKLSLDQDLTGSASKNLVGVTTHKGSLEKTVRVGAGRHQVKVRVAWDDNVKEETLAATFTAGSTRRLEIRLGRILKNLSVDWK